MKNFDKTLIAELDKWKDEVDSVLTRLLLLKENFEYREDFTNFLKLSRTEKNRFRVIFSNNTVFHIQAFPD